MVAENGAEAPALVGRAEECAALDRLLADALGGVSRVVVLRGEAGVGKSALLAHVSSKAGGWSVASAVGVESEAELAFSGLHQLCAPILDRLDRLPRPQRIALEIVFGLDAGPPPDRFLVALATLTLLAETAEQQPLICLVDDAHWLDAASAQIVGFVARRLLAERIAMVCAARTDLGDHALAGLPELPVSGLGTSDARALLLENVHGPLDAVVCDQIVAESHGNPLALLELPRTWDHADLAGGFGLPASRPVAGKIERSYSRRLRELPADTRLLLLAAAAEPQGDRVLLAPGSRSAGSRPGGRRSRSGRAAAHGRPRGSSSPTRSSGPPPTAQRPSTTGSESTSRSRRRPTPRRTRIGARGTALARRWGRARTSPPSWSARPGERRRAAGSPRPLRSCSEPPC